MRDVDDTKLGGRVRHQKWRNGRRIKTVRWVEHTPPKADTPEKQGKTRPGVQMKLYSSVDHETGFATNFVLSYED